MANITIRNIDDQLKIKLRIQAAQHGRSIEDEVCNILRVALSKDVMCGSNLAEAIRDRIVKAGGINIEPSAREEIRESLNIG